MKKLSTVQEVLDHAADTLDKVGAERDWYKDRYQKLAQEHSVDEVLSIMDERGLQPEVSRDELRTDLLDKAAKDELEVVKQAALLSGHGSIVSLGSADDQSGASLAKVSEAALESLLLTGDMD